MQSPRRRPHADARGAGPERARERGARCRPEGGSRRRQGAPAKRGWRRGAGLRPAESRAKPPGRAPQALPSRRP
eukprot:4311784-Alexandrium_andersonii.AAC.1